MSDAGRRAIDAYRAREAAKPKRQSVTERTADGHLPRIPEWQPDEAYNDYRKRIVAWVAQGRPVRQPGVDDEAVSA